MKKIMSVNAGSSSLKFKLYEMPEARVITQGIVERIGLQDAYYTIKVNGESIKKVLPIKDHRVAVQLVLDDLIDKKILKSLDELAGVGHRIVQGADQFDKSVKVTPEVKQIIHDLIDLAPLHNAAHLVGINAFEAVLPNVLQVVVFDTAFHQTMAPESYMYAIPYYWYTDYRIRKYGAHGTSHEYVAKEVVKLEGKPLESLKIVTMHLGNGASLAAIQNGKCVDTSMGLTPLEGIPMGTRSGNIDPTAVSFVCEKEGKTAAEVVNMLNKQSGYLGVSGVSHDSRDLEQGILEGNARCKLALDIQAKRIADYIGSYYVLLEGIDVLVFTAGIGENSAVVRQGVIDRLKVLGVEIDKELNQKTRGQAVKLSTPHSKIAVWIVPTDEELVIANDTYNLL